MILGKKIEKYRKEKGFTQSDMSVKLGISENTYRKYEKDNSSISLKDLETIAEFLDKSIFDFFPQDSLNLFQNKIKGDGYVFHKESAEYFEKLLAEKETRLSEKDVVIERQQEEISFLRKFLEKKN